MKAEKSDAIIEMAKFILKNWHKLRRIKMIEEYEYPQ